MSPSLKAVLALVFVVVLGTVLIQPILNSGDVAATSATGEPTPSPTKRTRPSPTVAPEETPEPSPEPSPSPEGGLISGPFRSRPLFDRYPKACLRKADPSGNDGLIATVTGGRIGFGRTDGPTRPGPGGGTRPGKAGALVGFNVGEDLLAYDTKSGVVIAPPQGSQGADGDSGLGRLRSVVWSPVSSCGVAIRRDGSLVPVPYDGESTVVQDDVVKAAFSPDGRKLALVLVEGKTTSVWVAHLGRTTMTEVHRERSGRPLSLKGWSPDAKTLYLTLAPRSGLTFVTVSKRSAPPVSGRVAAAPVTGLEQCGNRLLGIVKGGVAEITNRGPDPLTDTGAGFRSLACSPDGGFIAALRNGRLELLDAQGNFVRSLVTGSGYRDVYVDWGPRRAGLVVGRVPSGSKRGEVWYLPEGGAARNTGLTFTPRKGAIAWSASPPTGVPLR